MPSIWRLWSILPHLSDTAHAVIRNKSRRSKVNTSGGRSRFRTSLSLRLRPCSVPRLPQMIARE